MPPSHLVQCSAQRECKCATVLSSIISISYGSSLDKRNNFTLSYKLPGRYVHHIFQVLTVVIRPDAIEGLGRLKSS